MNQKGFAPILALWLVLVVIIGYVYLKEHPINFNYFSRSTIRTSESSSSSQIQIIPTESDLINPVKEFYLNLSSKKFGDAWDLLSGNFQKYAQNKDQFTKNYSTTEGISIQEISIQDLSEGTVYVKLQSVDSVNGQSSIKNYSGVWKLIEAGKKWKLDKADIKLEESSQLSCPESPKLTCPTPTPISPPTIPPLSAPNDIVDCKIDAACGGGTIKMDKNACSNTFCCAVPAGYVLAHGNNVCLFLWQQSHR